MASMLLPLTAIGQPVGAHIAGVVRDESGAVLQQATVTVENTSNGRGVTLATGSLGDYRAVALMPGTYDVTAAYPGFAEQSRRVTLFVGSDVTLNFSLAVSAASEQTTVTADMPTVEVARSQTVSVITKSEVEALPVLERNVLVLAQLLPGAGPINTTIGRFVVTKFGGVADQRSGYTTLVDGGSVDDAQWGNATINVSQDAVQEFKVFRNQFDAQYGHALNAVVSVATRSGTNRYDGSAYYFGRDDALNARYAFAATKLPFDEQRIGGAVGGPLARNQSHFFSAYERDHVDTVRVIAQPASNPFAVEVNGIFPAETENHSIVGRFDHRLGPSHALSVRYARDDQEARRSGINVLSDTNQTDIFNRSHSVIAEHSWTPTQNAANVMRVHLLDHATGTVPQSSDVGITRPSIRFGQTNFDSQVLSRFVVNGSNVLYLHTPRHDIKLGAEFGFSTNDLDSRGLEYGVFDFQTDVPFDATSASTWPTAFRQQQPTLVTYRAKEVTLFMQDDWRVGARMRVNAGLRYDLDLNLRINDFYTNLLADPQFAGLDLFVSGDRGTDTNNFQPRLGATWDTDGTGRLVVRGGWGFYVSRNRPWFQLRSMNQFVSSVVRITDPQRLRLFPDINAVLGNRTLDEFVLSGPRQLGTVIPDDFVQPYASTATAGAGWNVARGTTLEFDYVHSYANHQTGMNDRNLPASGPISPTNPRPVPQFSQVLMIETFSKSWYDALETQLRTRLGARDSLHVAYTLSRSYLDGVDFFLTTRGTQRTPHESGYNPTDQRHNLTLAGTVVLPGDVQVSGILKLISGSPLKVQAGIDLDADTAVVNDRPLGLPISVGRTDVQESQEIIDAFRTTRGLLPVDPTLLKLDAYRTLDARVSKSLGMGQNRRLELLLEAFNLTNRVNFRPPGGVPAEGGAAMIAPAFLTRTAARDARQIQWGVRYLF